MKISIFIVLMAFCVNSLFSQNCDVNGVIFNQSDEPVSDVNIRLMDRFIKGSSDQNGEFLIPNVKIGEIKIRFSRLGYITLDTTILLKQNIKLSICLKEKYVATKQIVVTGTKTAKDIATDPIPTEIISHDELRAKGNLNLADALSDQIGSSIVDMSDKNRGIQLQGLDPAYTLILINGEPVIGRSLGAISLDRLSVGNVKQIEIVKGPASSLYGSEALAGVINLITEKPENDFTIGGSARYGTFNSLNLQCNSEYRISKNVGINIFGERYSSDGFYGDGDTAKVEKVAPKFVNYTLNSELFYNYFKSNDAVFRFRLHTENQDNSFVVDSSNVANDNVKILDISGSTNINFKIDNSNKLTCRGYYTYYDTKINDVYANTGLYYDSRPYRETLAKIETQYDRVYADKGASATSMGIQFNKVETNRIDGGAKNSHLFFALVQGDVQLHPNLDLIASARLDAHSEYATRFSPKIAISYKALDNLIFKGSIGSGFKAPTYQQLYMDFTNPIVGYSVFGTAFVKDAYNKYLANNQIAQTMIDPNTIKMLSPEKSISYNLGLYFDLFNHIDFSINGFHNSINDMIDYQAIAYKTNGEGIYTYFNLNKIFTQGIETSFKVKFFDHFALHLSGQYLQTGDYDIINSIKAGKIFMNVKGGSRRATESDYGGLFNRSKYTGSAQLKYDNPEIGLNFNLRGTFRSRYGYVDKDGNGILAGDGEYLSGYSLYNFSCRKEIYQSISLQLGIDNLLNHKIDGTISSIPPRTMYISLFFNYNKEGL